jgi:hypothetical protein
VGGHDCLSNFCDKSTNTCAKSVAAPGVTPGTGGLGTSCNRRTGGDICASGFCDLSTYKCAVDGSSTTGTEKAADGQLCIGGEMCTSGFCDCSTYKCSNRTRLQDLWPCTRSQDCISSYCDDTSSSPPQCKTSPPGAGSSAIDTPCDGGKFH